MKRKRLFIILGIVVVLAISAVFTIRGIWYAIHGAERLTGTVNVIPKAMQTPPPIDAGPADWPNWRGPDGDGKSVVTGIRTDWTGGLTKLWEVNYLCQGERSSTWSSPVVKGNRLVVPGRSENSDLVFCLESQTGDLIWSGSYPAQTGTSHGPGSRATPYIDEDRVYTFGRGGDLVCWQLLDGQLLWRKNVQDVGGDEPQWGHSASPIVYEDKVFIQAGGESLVVAYDKMTGDVSWKSMEGTAGYAALALLKTGDDVGLLVFHGTGLACLNPVDGSVRWSVPWKTSYDVNATTPAVSDMNIFITSGYRTGCEAIRVENNEPEVLWRNKAIASHHSDPIIVDGFVYGYSGQSNQNRGDFKCLDLQTGTEKWTTDQIGWGTTVYVDGYLSCMDIDGNLFLVEPNPNEFKRATQFKGVLGDVAHPAWTLPIVANGKLYVRYMQRLICYDLMPQ